MAIAPAIPRRRITSTARWIRKNCDFTFNVNSVSQISSVVLSTVPRSVAAAQFTRMSSRPKLASALSMKWRPSSMRSRSACTNSVGQPDTLNTQEQAFLLRAAQRMLQSAGAVNIGVQAANRLPGAGLRWFVPNTSAARFTNSGSGNIWRTVTIRGVPTTAPAAEQSGVRVTKTLYTLQGQPADPTSLRQGDRVVVLSGLHDGDTVVTAGQIKLRSGAAVVIDNRVQPPNALSPNLPDE